MIVLLLVLLGFCYAQPPPYPFLAVPSQGRFGPSRKPNSLVWQIQINTTFMFPTNVTVALKSPGPDWDIAATLYPAVPGGDCASGWYNRTSGNTEYLTFPVENGRLYILKACPYTDTSSTIDLDVNLLTAGIICTRIAGFLDDQIEYKWSAPFVPAPALNLLAGVNYYEGSVSGFVIGHQTDTTRSVIITTPDNGGYFTLIYDVILKLGFTVTSDTVSEISVEECGTSKRSTELVRRSLQPQLNTLAAPVVCTFMLADMGLKLSYQWTNNVTNGAIQARVYTTRVVSGNSTSEGYGYIIKGGLTTFVWGQNGRPYAMIVDNLGRIGRTPKLLVLYHLATTMMPQVAVDDVNASITGFKCV